MTETLELYIPKPEDGRFYVQMMSDPETMAYNAPWFPPDGCIPEAEQEWKRLSSDWIGHEPERFYAYLRRTADGAFVGDVNFHYTPARDWWDMGIVIYAPERGKGYGKEGLRLLAAYAFSGSGGFTTTLKRTGMRRTAYTARSDFARSDGRTGSSS